MLRLLHIVNYAIIDEVGISFSSRLTVITGETGAGKSILMGALSLILGERADTGVLLDRERKCFVEGTFDIARNELLLQLLHDLDLVNDEDASELIIRREIAANGKSRAFVNDTPVNLDQLRRISSLLVDLHGQFDTLSISDSGFQRNVLDALAGNHMELKDYARLYDEWKHARDTLQVLREKKQAFAREYDYNRFLSDELEEADFAENELEEAEAGLRMLSNADDIKKALSAASDALTGEEQAIVQQLRTLQQRLTHYVKYHPALEVIVSRCDAARIELQDVSGEIDRLNSETGHDPARADRLNERLTTGYKLMKKHGVQSTAGLIQMRDTLREKLRAVLEIDELIAGKEKETEELGQRVYRQAENISGKRAAQVKGLQQNVNGLLSSVGMPNAKIRVSIEKKAPDATGIDAIEFLFDANNSKKFEPLRKVASGGELSRLMLSIKSLVAESMDMPTLIFDEIDTGISGEAARQVGTIMKELSVSRQVITITHQPQIAGKADSHLFVYKEAARGVTRTNIRPLSGEERITAIAKMLSGEKPTAAAIENAREMITG